MLKGKHKFALYNLHDGPILSSPFLLLKYTHRSYLPMNAQLRPQGINVPEISKNSATPDFVVGWNLIRMTGSCQ